ncbi:DUF3617 family protein [Brevundimonas sp.]|uniref:DUF3617 domain-containing protein n=1 Tax=Brevundimonas sp. TaxID=1871086 RepID=UPI0025BF5819|nr:DUF3617 family protein [Brevundimonas sp.]
MKIPSLITLASVLALSACGDQTAAPGADKAEAGETASTASNLSFDPAGMPIFKAGLWESTHVEGDEKGESNRMCVGPELDAETREQLFGEQPGCTKSVDRARGGLKVSGVCVQSGVHTKTNITMVGSQTEQIMTLEMAIDNTADAEPASTHKMAIKSRWVGPCPVGMQPGDLVQDGE